jgi:hypothetical protein
VRNITSANMRLKMINIGKMKLELLIKGNKIGLK